MNRIRRKLVSISLLVAAAVIGFDVISKAIDARVNYSTYPIDFPDVALVSTAANNPACSLLDNPANYPNAELVGSQEGESGLYELWLYEHPITTELLRYVSLDLGGMCGLAYDEDFDEAITSHVPLDVARSLVYQMFSYYAEEVGGIDVYRDRMLRSINDPSSSGQEMHGYIDPGENVDTSVKIDSVDLWAFNQLGINLPAGSYTVIDIDNAWAYD